MGLVPLLNIRLIADNNNQALTWERMQRVQISTRLVLLPSLIVVF